MFINEDTVLFPPVVEICHMIYDRIYMPSSIIQKWHTPITFILLNYIRLTRVKHSVFIIIQDYNSSVKYPKHHRDTLGVISAWKHDDQNILNNPKGNTLKKNIKLYHIYYVYIDNFYNK